MYACMHVCMYVCICMYTYTCVYISLSLSLYIYIYIGGGLLQDRDDATRLRLLSSGRGALARACGNITNVIIKVLY